MTSAAGREPVGLRGTVRDHGEECRLRDPVLVVQNEELRQGRDAILKVRLAALDRWVEILELVASSADKTEARQRIQDALGCDKQNAIGILEMRWGDLDAEHRSHMIAMLAEE